MCKSRRELSNAYLVFTCKIWLRYSLQFLKIVRFTAAAAENEPCKVCPLSAYRSPDHYYYYRSPRSKERKRRHQNQPRLMKNLNSRSLDFLPGVVQLLQIARPVVDLQHDRLPLRVPRLTSAYRLKLREAQSGMRCSTLRSILKSALTRRLLQQARPCRTRTRHAESQSLRPGHLPPRPWPSWTP